MILGRRITSEFGGKKKKAYYLVYLKATSMHHVTLFTGAEEVKFIAIS